MEQTEEGSEFTEGPRCTLSTLCLEPTGKLNLHTMTQFNYFHFVYDLSLADRMPEARKTLIDGIKDLLINLR